MNAPPLPTLRGDLAHIQSQILEFWGIHGQEVLYEQFDRLATMKTDDLHGEALEADKVFKPRIALKTHIVADPPQQLLTKWGVDSPRDVVLHPSVIWLVHVGLARFSQPEDVTSRPLYAIDIGDRFVWDDRRYEIKEVWRDVYWGNTNRPLYMRMTANLWRPTTTESICTAGNPGEFSGGTGSILGDERC